MLLRTSTLRSNTLKTAGQRGPSASAASRASGPRRPLATQASAAAPLRNLTILKGSHPDMLAGKGKKVFLVEFWATWCPPCVKSIPHLTSLAKKYKEKQVEVVGITDEDNPPVVDRFIAKMGENMDYTVAVDREGSAFTDYLGKYGVNSIPHLFVVNKAGDVQWHGHPLDPAVEPEIVRAVAAAASK